MGRFIVATGAHADVPARDEVLVRSVWNQHGKAIVAYATRLTDRRAAEDIVQQVLLHACRRPELRGPGMAVRGRLFATIQVLVKRRAAADALSRRRGADLPHAEGYGEPCV